MSEILDQEILLLCSKNDFDINEFREKFTATFDLLNAALNENTFKKYKKATQRFSGPFLISSYEVIAVGVFSNIEAIMRLEDPKKWVCDKIMGMYDEGVYLDNLKPGTKVINRFKVLSEWGVEYFKV